MNDGSETAPPSLGQCTRQLLGPLLGDVIHSRLPMHGAFGSCEQALSEAPLPSSSAGLLEHGRHRLS